MRILWVGFERVPHPDAVRAAVNEEEAGLVLELMRSGYGMRSRLVEQLRNVLREEREGGVAIRRRGGVYRPIGRRLAKWLSCALLCEEGARERCIGRIEAWLNQGREGVAGVW